MWFQHDLMIKAVSHNDIVLPIMGLSDVKHLKCFSSLVPTIGSNLAS